MITWSSVEQLNANAALRLVRLTDPRRADNSQAQNLEALDSLSTTPVGDIVRDLLAPQLPFRVKVYIRVLGFVANNPIPVESHFHLPPVEISPLQLDGATSWDEFEESLRDLVEWKIENMQDTPSDWTLLGIQAMEFTFLASANMAALQRHLPVLVAGGKHAPLPEALKRKQCCIDVPTDFDQCLRHALMWPFLTFPDGTHYAQLVHYVDNAPSG